MSLSPQQLTSPFIGLELLYSDYKKLEGILPTPTYKSIIVSAKDPDEVVIIYQIKHHLKTPYQYQWLSDIKLNWKRSIKIPFRFVEEYYINEYSHFMPVFYMLQELSGFFKGDFIKYPTPLYPVTPKELYKMLVRYAIKLHRSDKLTLEMVYATSMRMNAYFNAGEKLQIRELFKKAYSAYKFVIANGDNLAKKSKGELLAIRKENGIKRGEQKKREKEKNIKRIKKILPQHLKANKKPNISKISRELNLRRETVSRLMKFVLTAVFIIWLKISMMYLGVGLKVNDDGWRYEEGSTIMPVAKVTLFRKALIKGFKRGGKIEKC